MPSLHFVLNKVRTYKNFLFFFLNISGLGIRHKLVLQQARGKPTATARCITTNNLGTIADYVNCMYFACRSQIICMSQPPQCRRLTLCDSTDLNIPAIMDLLVSPLEPSRRNRHFRVLSCHPSRAS